MTALPATSPAVEVPWPKTSWNSSPVNDLTATSAGMRSFWVTSAPVSRTATVTPSPVMPFAQTSSAPMTDGVDAHHIALASVTAGAPKVVPVTPSSLLSDGSVYFFSSRYTRSTSSIAAMSRMAFTRRLAATAPSELHSVVMSAPAFAIARPTNPVADDSFMNTMTLSSVSGDEDIRSPTWPLSPDSSLSMTF